MIAAVWLFCDGRIKFDVVEQSASRAMDLSIVLKAFWRLPSCSPDRFVLWPGHRSDAEFNVVGSSYNLSTSSGRGTVDCDSIRITTESRNVSLCPFQGKPLIRDSPNIPSRQEP